MKRSEELQVSCIKTILHFNLLSKCLIGLDPAGPRFFDGKILYAIPELAKYRLNVGAATFVDIIHTNGGFTPCIACQPSKFC